MKDKDYFIRKDIYKPKYKLYCKPSEFEIKNYKYEYETKSRPISI